MSEDTDTETGMNRPPVAPLHASSADDTTSDVDTAAPTESAVGPSEPDAESDPEFDPDSPEIPTEPLHGKDWRDRWGDLDDRERELIADTVVDGEALNRPYRAALAATFAARRRRDLIAAVLVGPAVGLLALAVGASAGAFTRGNDAVAAFIRIITWQSGVPWVVAAVVMSLVAFLAARRRLGNLDDARQANREAVAET